MAVKKTQMYRKNLDTSETNLYPLTEAQYVSMDNGQTVQEVLSDRDSDKYTPVITNSSSTFKVGQGDNVDLSSSMKEGAYDSCMLKGKTMVNCIQEPSSQDVVLPYEFADGQYVTINDTKESGALGVELKGQTLVNIHDKKTPSLAAAENDWYSNLVIETNSISFTVAKLPENWRYISFKSLNLSMLKPNTKYLVAFEEASGVSTVTFKNGDSTHPLSDTVQIVSNKAIVTTTSDWVNSAQILYIYVPAKNVGAEVKVKNPMIIEYVEGMENWDIPYFEGMTSCKMPILSTVGENLFDNSTTQKYYTTSDGVWTPANNNRSTDFIRVKGDYKYHAKCFVSGASNPAYAWFDVNKNFIKRDSHQGGVVTSPSNAHYVKVHVGNIDVELTNENFLMTVSQTNTQITEHKNYKSSILSLPEEVVLRSLPNGVCDTFNTRTGVYIQRINEVVLDGNGSIARNAPYSTDNVLCFDIYNHRKGAIYHQESSLGLICDKLIPRNWISFYGQKIDEEGIVLNRDNGTTILIKIAKTKLITPNVDGVKAYLKDNPITVQYRLATPIEHKINLSSTLKSWNTTTHIYSEIPENTLYPTLSHSNPRYPVILKPSTKYSIVANSYSNNHTNSTINFNLGGATASTTVGNRVTTITTPSTLSNELLTMSGRGNKLNHVMVIEGDVMGDEPYFEGICDCKSPILSNVGKNLFDGEIEAGRWLTYENLGKYNAATGFRSANIITITPSSRYTISGDFKASGYFVFGNKDGYVTRYIGLPRSSQSMSFNTNPDECYGVWYTVDIEQTEANKPTNIQLEESSSSTTYEPYKSNILSCNGDKIELTKDMLEQGGFSAGSVVLPTYEQCKTSTNSTIRMRSKELIKVSPNTTYIVTNKTLNLNYTTYTFDSNRHFTGETSTTNASSFTTSPSCQYIAIMFSKGNNSTVVTSDFKESEFQIYEVDKTIVLRSLDKTHTDTLNVETGEYVSYVEQVVLTGLESENWNLYYDESSAVNPRSFYVTLAQGEIAGSNQRLFLNDKYPIMKSTTQECAWYFDTNGHKIAFTDINKRFADVSEWRNYLETNPITLFYARVTPIVSTIDVQGFPFSYENGHVILSSGSIEQSLTPTVEYSLSANKTGQINSNTKRASTHQKQLDDFEAMMLTSLVQSAYDKAILQFDYEMQMMSLGGE